MNEPHDIPSYGHVFYNKVFDLLVTKGGASEGDRGTFLHYHTHADHPALLEFRFCGKFGYGGKFYSDSYRVPCPFRVSYYPEDQTAELDALKDEINEDLKTLVAQFHTSPDPVVGDSVTFKHWITGEQITGKVLCFSFLTDALYAEVMCDPTNYVVLANRLQKI